ncbi:hypothetical protein SAMN06893097_1093 [Geodermatophilus sabuli]|uniref:Uncharacterized protein n=2 Tax=Geodermatophilus sabuli TaxID=1564158 RepID=A0A285EGE6_9ACTN|nr:hypothetical protein SAMN06893097_1093 [Geodermatophilus sabuli]
MAWWNWALVLWAMGATAGAAWLAVVLAQRVERREGQHQESDDLGWLLDEDSGRLAPARIPTPLLLLARLRHAVPDRSR